MVLHRPVARQFLVLLQTLGSLINVGQKKGRATDLEDLRAALRSRAVTHLKDEPLCLATCLGLEQSSIIAQSERGSYAGVLESLGIFWAADSPERNIL